jgi:hypothetical protein
MLGTGEKFFSACVTSLLFLRVLAPVFRISWNGTGLIMQPNRRGGRQFTSKGKKIGKALKKKKNGKGLSHAALHVAVSYATGEHHVLSYSPWNRAGSSPKPQNWPPRRHEFDPHT